MKIKILALAFLLFLSNISFAEGYTLTIDVKGVRNAQGDIYVELYADPSTFRKSNLAVARIKASAVAGQVSVQLNVAELGHYALMAYHDEDGDGVLNKRFGMIPTEGYALSNDPLIKMGPPAFEDCDFEVLGDSVIPLHLHY